MALLVISGGITVMGGNGSAIGYLIGFVIGIIIVIGMLIADKRHRG